jgi:uncharacterized lipoprotein YehR (DUF1307 family)
MRYSDDIAIQYKDDNVMRYSDDNAIKYKDDNVIGVIYVYQSMHMLFSWHA